MYYDKFKGRIIVDEIDIYLLIAILSIYATRLAQSHFSEEKKMERLRRDIIRQSKLFKSSSSVPVKDTSFATRVSNPSTLMIRGGNLERLKNLKLLTSLTKKIKQWINWLWFILYDASTKGKSNLILDLLRFNLLIIIRMWGLTIGSGGGVVQFELPNLLPPVVYGMVTGPILGFLGVSTTLALEFFIATLSTKSVMQQIIHNYHSKKYKGKFMDVIHETLKEESEFKTKISEMMEKANQIASQEPQIEIKPSNWNLDPEMERTAERFGIIVKESSVGEIVNESSDEIVKKSRLSSEIAKRLRKTLGDRYNTLRDIADTGKQIYDEYEEYITPSITKGTTN
jgi:hypothetical protein